MIINRTEPPLSGDEITTLRTFLNYYRDTIRLKVSGLTQEQLAISLPPSTMTLGGLVKHLAVVEDSWFGEVFLGGELSEPWASVDWEADRDWEWHTAHLDTPEPLLALFDTAVSQAERITDEALAAGSLDTLSLKFSNSQPGEAFSLRWILVHMIEEYARHAGHADLIRESIDGEVGD